MTVEIDPEVLKEIDKNLPDIIDENGRVINEENLNNLKERIEKLQGGEQKYDENYIDVVVGEDGILQVTKGGEPALFGEKGKPGKPYGKYMADFKTKTLDTFKSVDMTNGPLNDACDSAGKQISQGLIGSDGLATELAESIRINLQPELETQAQKGLKPEQTSTVTGTQVDSLPENVQTPEEAKQNSQNPTVQLMEKVTGLQDKIESWKNEAKKQGVDTKKYIDGKFDEIEKRLKDKLPTESQKSTLEKVIEVLKFLITLTGYGLAAYLTIAELKKHANEHSGCFVNFVDSKTKTTKNLYKVRQLTCNPDYKNVKPSNMQWADDNYTLSADCITGKNMLPNPSGCQTCYQELTSSTGCPCADSDNFVSLFCSNNYLANPDSQSSIVHYYHPEKQGLLDAFNDIAAYAIEIAKEAANDAAQGFGDLLKNLFKFIEYGVIIVGVVIIIYVILWLFGIIGERGEEKEVRIEVEPDTQETPAVSQQVTPPPAPAPVVLQPLEKEKSLDDQDPLELLAKIQKNGIKAAASEAGIVKSAPVPQQVAVSAPVPQQVAVSAPVPQQVAVSAPVPQQVAMSAPVPQQTVKKKDNITTQLFPDDEKELRSLSPSRIDVLTSGLDEKSVDDIKLKSSGSSVFTQESKSKIPKDIIKPIRSPGRQVDSQPATPVLNISPSVSKLSDTSNLSQLTDYSTGNLLWETNSPYAQFPGGVYKFRPQRKSIRVSRRLIK